MSVVARQLGGHVVVMAHAKTMKRQVLHFVNVQVPIGVVHSVKNICHINAQLTQ